VDSIRNIASFCQIALPQYHADDVEKFVTLVRLVEGVDAFERFVQGPSALPWFTLEVVEAMLPMAFYFDAPATQRALRNWMVENPSLSLLVAHDAVSFDDGWTWPKEALQDVLYPTRERSYIRAGAIVKVIQSFTPQYREWSLREGRRGIVSRKHAEEEAFEVCMYAGRDGKKYVEGMKIPASHVVQCTRLNLEGKETLTQLENLRHKTMVSLFHVSMQALPVKLLNEKGHEIDDDGNEHVLPI
jgi:hypothetical protein